MTIEKEFDYNSHIASLLTLLDQECESGRRINGLDEIETRRVHQAEIRQLWEQLQSPWQRLKDRIDGIPILPSQEHIVWAQSMQAMTSLRLLEVDTTTVGSDAEIIRVTLGNGRGEVVYDQFIRPGGHISAEATQRNTLTDGDVANAPTLQEVWPHIIDVFTGHYVVSFGYEWDTKTLKASAEKHGLPVPVIIGECLQRRSTAYYTREYYLSLEKVAMRMGYKLVSFDARARLKAQAVILDGMAHGITDINTPEMSEEPQALEEHERITGESDDGLEGLDEHPF